MKPFSRRSRIRAPRRLGTLGLTLFLLGLFLLYMAWPYVTLWRIDKAVRDQDIAALAVLVDLKSVRVEITNRLNKEVGSTIGELSDSFIRWLEGGIEVMGNQAVEQLVTLSWVRSRLAQEGGGEGFLDRVGYAFFDAPTGFVVRIGRAGDDPTWLRLGLQGLDWRITALYY